MFDLERDVPTTDTDVAALEAVRHLNAMDPYEYLRFLLLFAPQHPPTREIPPFHEPFEL